MNEICNQLFVKDIFRDKNYPLTLKCVCCNEESNFTEPFPFTITKCTNWINNFAETHKNKGCNNTQLDSPEWAAQEISFNVNS